MSFFACPKKGPRKDIHVPFLQNYFSQGGSPLVFFPVCRMSVPASLALLKIFCLTKKNRMGNMGENREGVCQRLLSFVCARMAWFFCLCRFSYSLIASAPIPAANAALPNATSPPVIKLSVVLLLCLSKFSW